LKSRESISPDGLMPADGAQAALRALSAMDSSLRVERILTGRSYTNEFARRAKDRFKA
jgi:NitT/TauT family transport system substrate-binding protein